MTSSLPTSDDAPDLLARIRAGDTAAEREVFEQYVNRLIALAQSRLSSHLAARLDPEDVVLSAYRSFFMAVREGRFDAENVADLWRLLAEVTLHKLFRQVQHHQAHKRAVGRDQRLSEWALAFMARQPSPEEEAIAADEFQAVLRHLPTQAQQALELRLQGFEHAEIAERLKCSERTIGRWIGEARRLIVKNAGPEFVPSAARSVRPAAVGRSEPSTPSPAEHIDTQYRWSEFVLVEQIGQGATGRVYRATHKPTGETVAIKFLRKSLIDHRPLVTHFVREADIVRQMSHPGIVAIHGVGRAARRGLFLVMEHVAGHDLEFLSRSADVPPRVAASWVAEAARTIQVAHERGIIHCDLKPGNLLRDERGHIRITDFGFAAPDAGVAVSKWMGTPAFMAPEQIEPSWGTISPRTDVWGLGGVLLFLLTRDPPNRGSTRAEVLTQASSKSAVPIPQHVLGGSNAALSTIITRCLVKDPGQRFASALELATALENYLAECRRT